MGAGAHSHNNRRSELRSLSSSTERTISTAGSRSVTTRAAAPGGGTTRAKSSVTPAATSEQSRGCALRLVPVSRFEIAGPVHNLPSAGQRPSVRNRPAPGRHRGCAAPTGAPRPAHSMLEAFTQGSRAALSMTERPASWPGTATAARLRNWKRTSRWPPTSAGRPRAGRPRAGGPRPWLVPRPADPVEPAASAVDLRRRRTRGRAGGVRGRSTGSAGLRERPPPPRPPGRRPPRPATQIPEETGGPFPGDGSNGVNVLTESGIVRSDITTSFGTASGVAAGVPLTVKLKVLDTKNGSAALTGAAVYLWHCDSDGRYSLYSDGVTQRELPARRAGDRRRRRGHLHEHLSRRPTPGAGRTSTSRSTPSLAAATRASDKLRTSQLALPEDACKLVYATDGYERERGEPGADLARHGQRVQRRLVAAARHRDRRRRPTE